jgi:hypothetical protein
MSFNPRNRSLLVVQDYTQLEFRYLLDLARDLMGAVDLSTALARLPLFGIAA